MQAVDLGARDVFGRLERAAATEDGKPPKQRLLVVGEEVVAPLDRRAQGVLARLDIAAALEQVEALPEPFEDLRHREDARARCGQLERERQLVEAAAQLADRLVGREPGAIAEQLNRLGLGERLHRVVDLAADAQQLAARDEQLQVGTALEKVAELRSGVDEVLEVVEQQEQLAVADVPRERLLRADGLRDRLHDERRVAQRREPDPEHARR